MSRLRILLAEKRLTEVGIVVRSICAEAGWTLELAYAGSREEIEGKLRGRDADLAILDLALLQPDAAHQVSVLNAANPRVPLVVSGIAADRNCAVECLAQGAQDVLLEGFIDDKTVRRVLQEVLAAERAVHPKKHEEVASREGCCCKHGEELIDEERVSPTARTQRVACQEVVQMLKRRIRSGDRVVPRRCGQIDLVPGPGSGERIELIRERLMERVRTCESALGKDICRRIEVRFGQESGSGQVSEEGGGCAFGDERCAVEQSA